MYYFVNTETEPTGATRRLRSDTYTDEQIIRLCQQGRQEGFSQLLQTYQDRVYRRAYSFLRNREDALERLVALLRRAAVSIFCTSEARTPAGFSHRTFTPRSRA